LVYGPIATIVAPCPSRPGEALDLLDASIDAGATIVAIGPYTNLALYEAMRPGRLERASVVLMGGYLDPPRPGLPQWGPNGDWNMHEDTAATRRVLECCRPLIVPFAAGLATRHEQADRDDRRHASQLSKASAS